VQVVAPGHASEPDAIPARTGAITGGDYVRALEGSERARLERLVFQQIALSLALPGSNIFDFGSGPGLDAKCYAEHGHSVDAFDQDPEMQEYFSYYCGDLISEGRVTQRSGTYEDFLTSKPLGWADVVTANFAPLNLIHDLRQLFRFMYELSRGRARVLASVLNPLCISDLKYAWWWRNLVRNVCDGEFYIDGDHGRVYRRSASVIAGAAWPYFRLLGTIPSVPRVLGNARTYSQRLERAGGVKPVLCRYVLVVLERVTPA
jgi:SAM-dependent methyltransferase